MITRRATAADAEKVAACVRAAYQHYIERIGRPPRPMLEDYEKVIEEREVLVAERGGELAGVVVLGESPEDFRVLNVAVDPRFQKTGVGRQLLQLAEAAARRQGFDSISLSTHEKMTENQALYARIGYREYGRRTEEGYARVFMRKVLAGGKSV